MIKNLLDSDESTDQTETKTAPASESLSLFSAASDETAATQIQPEAPEETARKSGLAFSAGIVLFASIVFMLILGWGADLLLGTSPWGMVGGIVVGSLIGFIQFFRLTSEIFRK